MLVKKRNSDVHSLLSSKGDGDSQKNQSSSSSSCRKSSESAASVSQNRDDKSFRIEQNSRDNKRQLEESRSESAQPQKKKKRRQPKTRLSFNSQVTIVSYNKYNQKLLSPPRLNESDDDDEEKQTYQGLKVAKKTFKKRTSNAAASAKQPTIKAAEKSPEEKSPEVLPKKRPKPILKKSTDSLTRMFSFNEDPQNNTLNFDNNTV